MKLLVLIVSSSVYQALTDQLRALDVPGFTVTHVEGHGPHTAEDEFLSGQDRVVGFVPRVRVEVVLPSSHVERVLAALSAPGSGLTGHGTYWLSAIESLDRF